MEKDPSLVDRARPGSLKPAPALGIAPLCAINASPAEYLAAGAAAGFDFVGIRISPVTQADPVYSPDGPEFRHLLKLVADSGLEVLDTEVFRVTADSSPDVWNPILDMSARLGAKLINVVGVDDDLSRLTDRIGRFTEDSKGFGITPVLEPIAYVALNSYSTAIDIAIAVGCEVELDALHALRTGLNPQLVADNSKLFPIFQLCDAPAEMVRWGDNRPPGTSPDDNDMIIESRYNRLTPGQGDAPLVELLASLAPGTPIAMEIPNIDLQSQHTVHEYIELMHREAVQFLHLATDHSAQIVGWKAEELR